MSNQKYVERILTGADLEMNDGRRLRIVSVGDYEPDDRSVGIFTGYVQVTCDDGQDYDILDNGDVYGCGTYDGSRLGKGPSLIPAEPDRD